MEKAWAIANAEAERGTWVWCVAPVGTGRLMNSSKWSRRVMGTTLNVLTALIGRESKSTYLVTGRRDHRNPIRKTVYRTENKQRIYLVLGEQSMLQ